MKQQFSYTHTHGLSHRTIIPGRSENMAIHFLPLTLIDTQLSAGINGGTRHIIWPPRRGYKWSLRPFHNNMQQIFCPAFIGRTSNSLCPAVCLPVSLSAFMPVCPFVCPCQCSEMKNLIFIILENSTRQSRASNFHP